MTMLDQALFYANTMKFYVFPCWGLTPDNRCACGKQCKSPAKHPITIDGFKSATLDNDVIKAWWTQHPDANIGVSTHHSDLCVLDVDTKSGGPDSLSKLIDRHGDEFMSSIRAKTGSGGIHLVMRNTWGLKSSSGVLAPGLDIRAKNGYIIAASSRHISGGTYEWAKNLPILPDFIAETPEWLRDALEETQPANGGPAPVPERIPKGRRNEMLLSISGTLVKRSLPESVIDECMQVINQRMCDPPCPAKDVSYLVRCALKYRSQPSDVKPVPAKVEVANGDGWWKW